VTERQRLGAKLDPVLREFADRVIIPALARKYLAQGESKRIAEHSETVSQFKPKTGLSDEVTL
jgi:hypothetical protein